MSETEITNMLFFDLMYDTFTPAEREILAAIIAVEER